MELSVSKLIPWDKGGKCELDEAIYAAKKKKKDYSDGTIKL